MKKILIALVTLFSIGLIATEKTEEVKVSAAWVRLLPGKMATGAFMKIENLTDKELSLVKAESTVSKVVELHDHIKIDGVMKMSKVDQIKVPAKGAVELKKGSLHIMLIDLKEPLVEKQKIDLVLYFSNNKTQTITAEVKKD